MLTRARLTLSAEMLDEAKAFLRIEQDEDDAPLGALMLAAIGHCETFTGIVLLEREMVETFSINGTWQRLPIRCARHRQLPGLSRASICCF